MSVIADGVPDQEGIFRGLAQAPLHVHNAVAELIDNAIAAKQKKFKIHIDISESARAGTYDITVIDDCLGISLEKLQTHVFKVGKSPPPGSSPLGEHGFGLKNVLAKIQVIGGSWEIWTRDKAALKKKECYFIEAPMRYELPIEIFPVKKWPMQETKGAGTIVKLIGVPLSYFKTVGIGKRGRLPSTISTVVEYLKEHLGVFYRGYLEGGRKAKGTIITSINWKSLKEVDPIKPDYKFFNKVKRFSVRTGKGTIYVGGEYGLIDPASKRTDERYFYYRNSPESAGVDFRVGDRVIGTRLIPEIWQIERHAALSGVCGEFNIPPTPGRVPKTLNNKTSIDFDDELWINIVDAIRRKVPSRKLPRWKEARREAELRETLVKQLKAQALPGDIIESPYGGCFPGAGVEVDIYRKTHAGDLVIYETKAGKTYPLDVYQLKLYWDGVVENGERPTLSILVANDQTTGAEVVMRYVNGRKDKKGNDYQLEFKKWDDFGIS